MEKRTFDAIVVGSGPNGLAAAICLQRAGIAVLLLEQKETIGGGLRSSELTLPGFHHDICSAVHPLAVLSPFFAGLPLHEHGLEFLYPAIAAAHPLDDGSAAALYHNMHTTVAQFNGDAGAYQRLLSPLIRDWPLIANNILGPLRLPAHPLKLAAFGLNALQPATLLAHRFTTEKLRALWAGMAAHSMQPISNTTTSAIAMVLMAAAHLKGWPVPKGGSASIARSLASLFVSLGGTIETNFNVQSLEQLPGAHAVLFDVTPRQLLRIAGHKFSSLYRWQLERYRYGMGVFKIDWAIDGAIPFTSPLCREAGTIHLGNTLEEIETAEANTAAGKHPDKPFVIVAQPSVTDASRAPAGKQTVWAYCHTPNASSNDMTSAIEGQIERYAPGFRERILAKHTMNCAQMEAYNPNYIGGDINGGLMNITQLFTRPVLRRSPYRTSAKGMYICSASTPPGGGVHGMCGYHAAKTVLKDVFGRSS